MVNSNLKMLSEIYNDTIFKMQAYPKAYTSEKSPLKNFWKEIDEKNEKILEFMNQKLHLGLKVSNIDKLK